MKEGEVTPARARYIMIGGFLGAGKTTAMARLARRFTDLGKRVGLISNDQSSGLVDTALLRSKGFPVEEIPGGCFCCRFNSLLEAADNLDRSTRPDVFLAEPDVQPDARGKKWRRVLPLSPGEFGNTATGR